MSRDRPRGKSEYGRSARSPVLPLLVSVLPLPHVRESPLPFELRDCWVKVRGLQFSESNIFVVQGMEVVPIYTVRDE